MMKKRDSIDFDGGAEKLKSVLRDQKGLGVDRMPGLAHALYQFVVEAQRTLLPLLGRASGAGAIEPAQGTTLFQAVNDCGGLAGAIYSSVEPEGLLLIALDERIDRLIVASVFGEIIAPSIEGIPEVQEPRSPTAIERALIEEFARALGRALETAFASIVPEHSSRIESKSPRCNGAVVSLDQRVGDPVDIVVNGKTVARGEIVVVDEAAQRFGVSLLEIIGVAGAEQAA
jgi:hypothetical protein